MDNIWVYWLVFAGMMFIGEMLTVGFLLFWVGIAAIVAMTMSLLGANLYLQISAFIVLSAMLIVFTKPLTSKFLKQKDVKTNASSIEGKKGIVIVPINNVAGTGQVKVSGESWSASSDDLQDIEQGAEIEVERIEGVKVIVKRIKALSGIK